MPETSTPQHFRYEGRDGAVSSFLWITPLIGVPILWLWGWRTGVSLSLACLVLGTGLRSSLYVTNERALLVRKLFCIPYWRHSSQGIDYVTFDGDWGLSEGALGVVIVMDGKERLIGNERDMEHLVNGLMPFTRSSRIRG